MFYIFDDPCGCRILNTRLCNEALYAELRYLLHGGGRMGHSAVITAARQAPRGRDKAVGFSGSYGQCGRWL